MLKEINQLMKPELLLPLWCWLFSENNTSYSILFLWYHSSLPKHTVCLIHFSIQSRITDSLELTRKHVEMPTPSSDALRPKCEEHMKHKTDTYANINNKDMYICFSFMRKLIKHIISLRYSFLSCFLELILDQSVPLPCFVCLFVLSSQWFKAKSMFQHFGVFFKVNLLQISCIHFFWIKKEP